MVEPEIIGRALELVVIGTDDIGGIVTLGDQEDAVLRLLALRVTTLCVVGEPPITVAVVPTDPGGKVLATLITFCPPGPGVATI